MSRLDQHIAKVQTKLALRNFGQYFARTTFVMGLMVLVAVIVHKLYQIFPAELRFRWVIIGGLAVCAAISAVWAYLKRPSREAAAAAIDEKLRLKEKFSTAIYVRPSSDPFAMAAVRDAESTATKVQIEKQFPIPYPRMAYASKIVFAVALLLAQFVPTMNVFGKKEDPTKKQEVEAQQQGAKEAVQRAIAAVETMPKSVATTDEFKRLVAELRDFNKAPKIDDPAKANRRALQALQEVNNQVAKDWDKAKKYAEAQNALMNALQPPDDAKGPVGEARKEIAKGNFDAAAQKLEEAVKDFDKMDEKAKEDAAKQMEAAAKQLEQLANDPNLQQQIQQQLQQMGATQQQAQQMQQTMQQAAAGNQQAQQQLQQMAQQMSNQMNNGQGANQQQQQQMQQMMQQMQAQAQAQNQANGLSQAAAKMAQAMQQAQQAQQQNPGGGQQNPQAGQAMAQAQQQMQQALQNMQGTKQDLNQLAQQLKNAQQNLQQGQQCANGQCNNPGNQMGVGQKPGQGQGQMPNQGNKPNGQGPNPGLGAGGNAMKEVAPFGVRMEQSPSEDDENGKILASYLVKDKAEAGQQKMKMQALITKAQKEATDEVDSEHANRAAQKVAQEYFRTMQQDVQKK
jgi:hypothetical protein